jgi:hypothetical protein
LSGTNLSDFGQHAAPITAGPAAPLFQNVSASLYSSAIQGIAGGSALPELKLLQLEQLPTGEIPASASS